MPCLQVLGGQAAIGAKPFTNNAYYVTPTIAAGKGWGDFDIEAAAVLLMERLFF